MSRVVIAIAFGFLAGLVVGEDDAPTPTLRLPVRHVDPAKLAATLGSVVELWDLAGELAITAAPEEPALDVTSDHAGLRSDIYRLAVLLDRPRSEAPASTQGDRPVAQTRVRPDAPRASVDLLAGEVPVLTLVRFLADSTRRSVLVEDEPSRPFEATVRVVTEVREVDAAFVEALLETNGWSVDVRSLPGGREVIRVVRADAPPTGIPEPRPILRGR